MELASITVNPDLVEAQLARYAGHHDRTSTAIRTALSALQAGLMVVDLRTVFADAMLAGDATTQPARHPLSRSTRPDARLNPSVAIAPAGHAGRQVRLTIRGDGELRFRSGLWRLWVPQDVRTSPTERILSRWVERVPETPAYIETRPRDLVLWEANWQSVPRREFDPALLEHLDGWLFLVREVWDLSDVERGVLT